MLEKNGNKQKRCRVWPIFLKKLHFIDGFNQMYFKHNTSKCFAKRKGLSLYLGVTPFYMNYHFL